MKIIFIGNPVEEKNYSQFIKYYKYAPFADNKAMLSIINGLQEKYKNDFLVMTINSSNKKITEYKKFNNSNSIQLKYNNRNDFTYFASLLFNIKKQLKKICEKYKKEKIIIITNGPYLYYSYSILLLKKKYKIKFFTFITGTVELPQYKGIYGFVAKMGKFIMKRIDGSITYVKASSVDYSSKPFVEILYTINSTQLDVIKNFKINQNNKNVNILFSGTLSLTNGINKLLDVANHLPKNYYVTICGNGDCKDDVINGAKINRNILYKGFLNHEEITKLQINSTALIIIRNKEGKIDSYYSRYASSSKLIEYLLSGTPVITNDFAAIPNELRKFLNIIDDSSASVMADEIQKICSEENRDLIMKKAAAGQKYVIRHAHEKVQNKKIIDFLENEIIK